jgi:hypothetical protein
MRDLRDGPRADHDRSTPRHDRLHELRDIVRVVLVVRVRIHDHIRAEPQAGIEPGHKAAREPLVKTEIDDVIHAIRPRHLDGAVG